MSNGRRHQIADFLRAVAHLAGGEALIFVLMILITAFSMAAPALASPRKSSIMPGA